MPFFQARARRAVRPCKKPGIVVAPNADVRSLGRQHQQIWRGKRMPMTATPPWALLLAGGDGRRLKPLTRQIAGDPRPKQFCAILDGETLLHRTRRRAELFTRPDQHVVVVSREHEPYYRELAGELDPDPLPLLNEPAFPIRRFWEKPSLRLAQRLFERGALWNSFVMVGWVDTFLGLTRRVAPDLLTAFDLLRPALGGPREAEAAERVRGGGSSTSIWAASRASTSPPGWRRWWRVASPRSSH